MGYEVTPEASGLIAAALVESAVNALTCRGWTIHRSGVVPGTDHAQDTQCGSVTVSIDRLWLTSTFPSEEVETSLQASAFVAASFTLEVRTCVPGLAEDGTAPNAVALQTAALTLAADGAVMWEAIGYMLDEGPWDNWLLGNLQSAGPLGRTAGWTVPVTVELGGFCPRLCS